MEQPTDKKRKKKWPIILVAILVLGALAYFSGGDSTTPSQPESTSSVNSSITEAKKEDIQVAIEALVDEKYRGQGYSLDLLTAADGSGYIVSLQIDVDVAPPESTEIIDDLENKIAGLGYTQISEIHILAVKDMQIVDSNDQ